jgi:ParB family chromosome partitioning protein
MTTDRYGTYRGDVWALAAAGDDLVFVTAHPEKQPTGLYRFHPEKLALAEEPLPAGGQALLAAGDDLWVAGTDQRLYRLPAKGKAWPCPAPFDGALVALAPLSANRLAVAAGTKVIVLARGDGKVSQAFDLPEPVTCLAADPTGQWLAVGTAKGTVSVFECESDAAAFRLSDSAPLHEAAVTALLFEADELRFLSAGADQKLLSTHARGRLEAEDRGRGANHEQPITAMVAGPKDRFITGSSNGTLKSWPRAKGARPVTLKDGVGKVVALAVVPVQGRPQVAAACDDNTIRLFQLDEEGKFGEATVRLHGAEEWAKNEMAQPDPKRREAALRQVAGWGDAVSVKRLAAQMTADADHALRLLACQLLGESGHPHAAKALEKGLGHKEEAVRVQSFEGLRRLAGPNDLRPLALALKADKADIGVRAVQALEGLAAKDDQAMARLTGALQSTVPEVRQAALASLEKVHPADSPEASLTALGSPHADLRRLALLRLYQRGLLNDPRAQAALRWRGDDGDPEVRRVAFLLSLHTREKLLRALRERDPELERQLTELASGTLPKMEQAAASQKGQQSGGGGTTAAPVPAGAGVTAFDRIMKQVEDLVQRGALPPELAEQIQQQMKGGGRPGMITQIMALMHGGLEKLRQSRKPENDS